MRYGTVPDGHDKSMTHLEYEEAQNCKLPSLIYILNDEQPIPAKDVETGLGADKLRSLKDLLRKRHTVSFFTSPEDLQSRILHDVSVQLDQMGVTISGSLETSEEVGDNEVLNKFAILPKLFSGREVTVEFKMGKVRSAFSEDCLALRLEMGATVCFNASIGDKQSFEIYAERDIALRLLTIPVGTAMTARVNTAFGTATTFQWADDGIIPEARGETGLVITQILGMAATDGPT
jgi:hypothetical protein